MKAEVIYEGVLTFTPDAGDDAGSDGRAAIIADCFAATMRELVKLGAIDPVVTGSATTGHIEISAMVEADSFPSAVQQIDPTIRAALHAAGVCTEGWQDGHSHQVSVDFQTYRMDVTQPLAVA